MTSVPLAWLAGVALGLGVAAPIGPINIEIIRRHVDRGLAAGLLLGLGACTVDLSYILLLTLGLVSAGPSEPVQAGLSLVGGLVLAALAAMAIRAARRVRNSADPLQPAQKPVARRAGPWRHYAVGVVMTASAPMNLVFWLGVVAGGQYVAPTAWGPWPIVGGVMCGTAGWVLGLNLLLAWARRWIRPGVMAAVNLLGAAILAVFAGRALWRFAVFITSQ